MILSLPDPISPFRSSSQQERGENRLFLPVRRSSPLLLAGWISSIFTKRRRSLCESCSPTVNIDIYK
ncbi:hypothetical protein TIFTF001_033744 [Ficus carica]|uniref:Uncharacterized protein n=1 Tax=Ficus carica TaxID=3494 RepID=A0AA88J7L0_FICCA|nr:hypothetical protein TIFTF001_033744 [Ficus carica]